MRDNFYLYWVISHTLVIGIGFSIGLSVGLFIPIIGDVIAMLAVGLMLMSVQYYLLVEEVKIEGSWMKYSFLGLLLGVAGSFIFTLLTNQFLGLANSHILSFPITVAVYTIFQSFLLKNKFERISIWPITSLVALGVAFFLLFLISMNFDLGFDLLGDRRQEIEKIPLWGITGAVIGFVYSIPTAYVLR